MKTTIGDMFSKIHDLDKSIATLCTHIIEHGCGNELDGIVEHLENYRDMILDTKIDI